MKASFLLALVSLLLTVPLRAQAPKPTPAADYVVIVPDADHPKLVPYTADMTLLVAITSAGDFNEFGSGHVILIRGGKKVMIKLKSLRQDPVKDPKLEPWDIVYYPQVMF